MKLKAAIVRPPAPTFVDGITTAGLGKPDHYMALKQHAAYVRALESCGLRVICLTPDVRFPDSTFVEDTAILADSIAVVLRPGAPSRQGEEESIEQELRRHFQIIERIVPPGTVDGGDIMRVENHFYIGLSSRTNTEGADQLRRILREHGFTSSTVALSAVLHLKSAVSYIEHNNLVCTPAMAALPQFASLEKLIVPDDETYAANCIWINGTVLVAAGYPRIRARIQSYEYSVIELDMSEFRKLDGGLSCLSLRF